MEPQEGGIFKSRPLPKLDEKGSVGPRVQALLHSENAAAELILMSAHIYATSDILKHEFGTTSFVRALTKERCNVINSYCETPEGGAVEAVEPCVRKNDKPTNVLVVASEQHIGP